MLFFFQEDSSITGEIHSLADAHFYLLDRTGLTPFRPTIRMASACQSSVTVSGPNYRVVVDTLRYPFRIATLRVCNLQHLSLQVLNMV